MKRELTRTREKGTRVTAPNNPQERMQAMRRIVDQHQYEKIDGCMIDLTSAHATLKVYDALNTENRAKFSSLPAPQMALIAFKLLS